MAAAFQKASVPSEAGDDSESDSPNVPSNRAGKVPEVRGGSAGIFASDKKGVVLKGKRPREYDNRKFKYDVTRGKGMNIGFDVTKEDRMSAAEAGAKLDHIHEVMGVARETEGLLRAFDKALFFSHSVNGGSVLMPGRATFSIPGVSQVFSLADVRDILGVDQRRFFRAYADEIAEVNKEVIDTYDPYDVVSAEQWAWLMQVASERGLQRYPHLAHDSADSCTMLSAVERAALAASKTMVISTTNNSADRMRPNNRVASADNYDSSVGAAL